MRPYSIGVDLGGTNLRAAAVSSQGEILKRVSSAANFTGGADPVIRDIVASINELRSCLGTEGLRGVGIGVPGFIDMAAGVVIGSANLPGFDNFPVRE